MRQLLPLLILLSVSCFAYGQKVLQIEKFGSPKTEKIEMGTLLTYQVNDDDIWSEGYIRDLRIDQNIIEFDDRFVKLDNITALRYERNWPRQIGTQLALFGLAWSGYALIGTLTDGNPDTNYQWSDAAVTGAAAGIGFSLPLFIGDRTVKLGKRKRLRMLDLRF
ncbi:MAG TPA: hypothetical protein VJ953_15295 [Saprospiraceae bacterium]|nr:hypothetical protein [Saprospiraceae bacterium]